MTSAAHTAARKTVARRASRIAAALALTAVLLAGPVQAREAGVASAVNADARTLPPRLEERTLVVGHRVVFDEKITTRGQGQAQLLMLDQSAVTVAPDSELTIDKFVYDPDRKTGEMALNLSRGLMRFVGGRLSKSGKVTVRTPVATMGIRGGIALFNVITPKIVDVTLLFGDAVEGETEDGRPFVLRRHGYFTRIEAGKAATPPLRADAQPGLRSGALSSGQGGPGLRRALRVGEGASIAQALLRLQGRSDATAGAPVRPTEAGAGGQVGQLPAQAQFTRVLNIGVNAGVKPPARDTAGVAESIRQTGQALGDQDPNLPPSAGGGSIPNGGENGGGGQGPMLVQDRLFTVSGAQRGPTLFPVIAEAVEVVGGDAPQAMGDMGPGVDPADFKDGDRLFIVNNANSGQALASPIAPGGLAFSENGVGDSDAVPNIFDANDPTLYLSPDGYNADAPPLVGPGLAAFIAARNESSETFFFYDLTSPDFDGVNGARISLFAGQGVFGQPTGRSFFFATSDSQTSSFLPYSDIGQFQLPVFGVQPGDTRFINSANVHETPVMADWDKGKALYIGGVFQDLRQDSPSGEMVYGVQAVVANLAPAQGATPAQFVGLNGGSPHFLLNGTETRRFHVGETLGLPVGGGPGDRAILLTGFHRTLEPVDRNQVRRDPVEISNIHFGRETAPIALDAPGAGVDREALFAAVLASDVDGEIENLATNPTAPTGAGLLTIDRDAMEAAATVRLEDEDDVTQSFSSLARNSAFFDDKTFAIVHAPAGFAAGNEVGFVLVSGEAASGFRPCLCAFMHWGFFAGGESTPGEVANSVTDIGFFFAGAPTVDMPPSGQATYMGGAFASLMRAGEATPGAATGAFQLTTNFATGVSAGDMNLGPESFNIVGRHTPGAPALQVQYSQGGQPVGQGHGGFFGPSASNVGVTIDIDDGAGLKAAGGAIGQRQP